MLTAGERALAGQPDEAVAILDAVATNGEIPEIYRQIAAFKAVTTEGNTLLPDDRLARLQGLAQPGSPLRLLAEEQLALAEVEYGNRDAAIEIYQNILVDAEVTSDLQQRAVQVIVALGGTPNLSGLDLQEN